MADNLIDIGKEILKQVDIVDIISSFIKVTKKGRNYVAICPFHNDTNPSLTISQEKQIFKCFTCGVGGDGITFVRRYKNCPYLEALKIVASIGGIKDERLEKKQNNVISEDLQHVYDCLDKINSYYELFLFQSDDGRNIGLKYFHDRGLTDDIIREFSLGFSPIDGEKLPERLLNDGFSLKTIEKTGIGLVYNQKIKDNNCGRVIFSIKDGEGHIVGFSARSLTNDKSIAKYVNSPETNGGVFKKSKILYNFSNAKDEARRLKFVYVVEGFMDAIAVNRAGFKNVVALMGTALTADHINLLRYLNCEVRLCLDNDNPGQDAMMKNSRLLADKGIKFRLVNNKQVVNGKDSDEILKNSGSEGLSSYLNNLISEGEFILNYYSKNMDLSQIINKKQVLINFIPFLVTVKDQLDKEIYIKQVSQLTGYSIDTINGQIKRYIERQSTKSETIDKNVSTILKSKHSMPKELNDMQLCERQILRYMLENKEAVNLYNEKLGYLPTDSYREIATLIEEYSSKNAENNYSANDIIGFVDALGEEDNIKNKDDIINTISDLSFDNNSNFPPYSKDAFVDCIYLINEKKEFRRSYQAYEENTIGKDEKDKAEQAKILLEKRKALLEKREKERNK